ncbi:MAG: Maf family protein [Eubacteriales bacterium]|jgi:septum formation protein
MEDVVIYLASSSPRRRNLLEQLGVPFCVLNQEVDEAAATVGTPPRMLVQELAQRKALAAAEKVAGGLVIGADTIVCCGGQILGKPATQAEAEQMLFLLRGRQHEVYTGVAVVEEPSGNMLVDFERTVVRFCPLTAKEIKAYAATGEPVGKAGAYAIQGLAAIFIEGIAGCYSNVVGLPLACLARMLKVFGVDLLEPERIKVGNCKIPPDDQGDASKLKAPRTSA